MHKLKMLTVGSINMDIIASNILYDDEKSMTCVYDSYSLSSGGKGLNQASTIAKLACDSYIVGCVGDDRFGQIVLSSMEKAGVNTRYVRRLTTSPTGISLLGLEEDGRYRLSNIMAATNRITEEDVERALDEEAFDMIFMQFEMPQETVYKTYQLASKRNIPVILDAGPPRPWSLEPLTGIYMISPNATEAYAMTGILPIDEDTALAASRSIWEKVHPQYVILKMGSQGAYIYCDRVRELIPTFSDMKPLDTTGCGDIFTAVLGIKLIQGLEIRDAVRFANAAASIACTRLGGLSSIPTPEEVQLFLDSHP